MGNSPTHAGSVEIWIVNNDDDDDDDDNNESIL